MGPWRNAALLMPSEGRCVDSFVMRPAEQAAASEGPRPV